jgi:hypothetical protein
LERSDNLRGTPEFKRAVTNELASLSLIEIEAPFFVFAGFAGEIPHEARLSSSEALRIVLYFLHFMIVLV